MIFDGWKFQNETCDQNDFETSELIYIYIHEWAKKNDFEK